MTTQDNTQSQNIGSSYEVIGDSSINIDRETPRESSDYMALGSGFKQVTYKEDENE